MSTVSPFFEMFLPQKITLKVPKVAFSLSKITSKITFKNNLARLFLFLRVKNSLARLFTIFCLKRFFVEISDVSKRGWQEGFGD